MKKRFSHNVLQSIRIMKLFRNELDIQLLSQLIDWMHILSENKHIFHYVMKPYLKAIVDDMQRESNSNLKESLFFFFF